MYACPINPAFEAMLTMFPPVSRRCGIAAWLMKNGPERLTARTWFHSSSVVSVACEKRTMPATFARTSRRP